MLNQSFSGYKPDWIKYFDRSTGLGLDLITERKFWTGLGLQKSPICSTLVAAYAKTLSPENNPKNTKTTTY